MLKIYDITEEGFSVRSPELLKIVREEATTEIELAIIIRCIVCSGAVDYFSDLKQSAKEEFEDYSKKLEAVEELY